MNFSMAANRLIEVNGKGSNNKAGYKSLNFISFGFLLYSEKCKANTNKPKQMNFKTKDKKKDENHGRDAHTDVQWEKDECTKASYLSTICMFSAHRTRSLASIFPVSVDVLVSYRLFFFRFMFQSLIHSVHFIHKY